MEASLPKDEPQSKDASQTSKYQQKVKSQVQQFANTAALWKLPPIHFYWMKKHIQPRIYEVMGCMNALEFYSKNIQSIEKESIEIVSVGSGDCNIEIALATELKSQGVENFRIECLELSGIRLERAKVVAARKGVLEDLVFTECDLNFWKPEKQYDVIIAHHSLHHLVELEQIFSTLKQALSDEGLFLSIDMIGRNGYMRWPEALEVIEGLWSIIPDHYKFNYQFNKHHEKFLNWDCSKSGFEGIRSQDILPLLVENFAFQSFLGYGNIIDPFIERGYGHNLDPKNPKDFQFIDFVEGLNIKLIDAGLVKPTIMFAVMSHEADETKCFHHWTPTYCIRKP
ncbi:MAG: class I SAM-dependent methyltransferase [Geitlerinemataceae cyanobacterium]